MSDKETFVIDDPAAQGWTDSGTTAGGSPVWSWGEGTDAVDQWSEKEEMGTRVLWTDGKVGLGMEPPIAQGHYIDGKVTFAKWGSNFNGALQVLTEMDTTTFMISNNGLSGENHVAIATGGGKRTVWDGPTGNVSFPGTVQATDYLDADGDSILISHDPSHEHAPNIMLNSYMSDEGGIVAKLGGGADTVSLMLSRGRFDPNEDPNVMLAKPDYLYMGPNKRGVPSDLGSYEEPSKRFTNAYFEGKVQATDYLDAEGNSIIGAGGGENYWSKVAVIGGNPLGTIGVNYSLDAYSSARVFHADTVNERMIVFADKAEFTETIQATDYLDAEGNSIIGAGGGSPWTELGGDIYFDNGTVHIGQTPLMEAGVKGLQVGGNISASGTLSALEATFTQSVTARLMFVKNPLTGDPDGSRTIYQANSSDPANRTNWNVGASHDGDFYIQYEDSRNTVFSISGTDRKTTFSNAVDFDQNVSISGDVFAQNVVTGDGDKSGAVNGSINYANGAFEVKKSTSGLAPIWTGYGAMEVTSKITSNGTATFSGTVFAAESYNKGASGARTVWEKTGNYAWQAGIDNTSWFYINGGGVADDALRIEPNSNNATFSGDVFARRVVTGDGDKSGAVSGSINYETGAIYVKRATAGSAALWRGYGGTVITSQIQSNGNATFTGKVDAAGFTVNGVPFGGNDPRISDTNISNWNTAFGWGNHASAGYAKGSFVPTSGNTTISGTLTATDFVASSDERLKDNIATAPVGLIDSLKGREWDWKESGEKGSGVVAQELEQILPHLVHTDDEGMKSVAYNGLIAYLIEELKDCRERLAVLEAKE